MHRLQSNQKSKVAKFVQCTHQPDQVALAYLQHSDWNMERAVDLFYQNPRMFNFIQQVDRNRLESMFAQYANDPRDDVGAQRIGPNGILKLLTDLQFEPTDRKVLLLACKLGAQTQCEFSWEEWNQGMTSMKVDSVDSLRDKLRELDAELSDPVKFRELYLFAFNYGRLANQRSLDLETALAYWRIVFQDKFPLHDLWEKFLLAEHGKPISRDTWNLLLDFCVTIKPDLSNYDDEGAWPVLIDQFVDYARDTLKLPRPTKDS